MQNLVESIKRLKCEYKKTQILITNDSKTKIRKVICIKNKKRFKKLKDKDWKKEKVLKL